MRLPGQQGLLRFGHDQPELLVQSWDASRRSNLDYETLGLVVGGLILFIAKFTYMVFRAQGAQVRSNGRLRRYGDFTTYIGPLDDDWMHINSARGLPMADQHFDISEKVFGTNAQYAFLQDSVSEHQTPDDWMLINPATGLPMAGHFVDVGGNVFGTSAQQTFPHGSGSDHQIGNFGFDVAHSAFGTFEHF
jgi:hypothetical protein